MIEHSQPLEQEPFQLKLEKLKAELVKGEQSGLSLPLDLDAIEQEALAELESGNRQIDPCVNPTSGISDRTKMESL